VAGTDIIHFGGGHYGVRDLHNAWVAAGSPPINSAGRLYAEQKQAWDAYQGGWGSPADNPDQPDSYELAHVRFAALDINATPERVRALSAAGLVRPFSYESWHWRLPNIYNYPLVHSIPTSAGDGSTSFPEDDMAQADLDNINRQLAWIINALGAGGADAGVVADADTILGATKAIRAEVHQISNAIGAGGAVDGLLPDSDTVLGRVRSIDGKVVDPKA